MSFALTFASPGAALHGVGVRNHPPPCSSLGSAADSHPESSAIQSRQPQRSSPLVDGICVGLLLAAIRRIPRHSRYAPGRGGRVKVDVEEDPSKVKASGKSFRHWSLQSFLSSVRRRLGLKKKASEKAPAAQEESHRTELEEAGDEAKGSNQQTNEVAKKKGYFFDAEEMKDKVRTGLIKETYNVQDFYKTTGWAQRIARAPLFENITLAVISLNAVWIGIDTDLNKADVLLHADPIFQIADNFFCGYFFFEWVVRWMSFKRKRDAFKDRWFTFDTGLVSMMVLETWVMTAFLWATGAGGGWSGGLGNASILRIFRLLRLSRMTRMVRLLRTMPELVILVKGMVAAIRSVFFTFCLLFIMLYVFGITFRQMAGGNPVLSQLYFSSVPASMYNLLIHGTFLDSLSDVVLSIGAQSRLVVCVFWIFVLLSALTVMNMLIGILCEVVSAVSATEKEAILVSFVKEKMQILFLELDETGDGRISREEFLMILEKREACRLLQDVGVDVIGLVDQVDIIFADDLCLEGETEKTLDFPELMELILSLRGSCSATVKDIIDLRKFVRTVVGGTNKSLARISDKLDSIEEMDASPAASLTPGSGPAAVPLDLLGPLDTSASGSEPAEGPPPQIAGEGADPLRRLLISGSGPASVPTPGNAGEETGRTPGSHEDLVNLAEALETRLRSRTEGLKALVGELEAELAEVRRLRAHSEAMSGASAAEGREAVGA